MNEPAQTVPVCYRHTSRETYVKCTRCERPICPDCMTEASVGFQCPECVAEGRRSVRPALTVFGGSGAGRDGTVTKVLIGLNILAATIGVVVAGLPTLIGGGLFTDVTAWQLLTGALGQTITVVDPVSNEYVIGAHAGLGTIYTGIDDGAFYRLFTAMFVHYGIFHLLMNMYVLWFLGRQLEEVLGRTRFLALYLLAGFGGNVLAYLVSDFMGDASPTAGASTAVFGLFAAFFVVLRRLGKDTSQVVTLLVVNLVITFVLPGISWAGHIGGLITGALFAVALAYAPKPRRTLIQAAGGGAIFVIWSALTVLAVLT
jgi:membrane associated rhomboid family serine protease